MLPVLDYLLLCCVDFENKISIYLSTTVVSMGEHGNNSVFPYRRAQFKSIVSQDYLVAQFTNSLYLHFPTQE